MNTLIFWDSTLAYSAQNYADTCPTSKSGATGYGENIFNKFTTSPATYLDGYATDAPYKWDEQLSDFGLSSLTMDATILASGVADATQMYWAKTKYVGCGVKNCGPDPSQANKTRIVVVCHYTPK
ncbi:Protein CBG21986 [Caenorhabditis briggsae]|uniref:Protein CBG21986 n=1 Tax=Caenorhabditis briggsae TaxID=6238 RepID=A8Y1A2_CAEBR|nr:Protein CBG21986 [Caenorhabditis briggsae]CAP38671.2 Protein CBG21986 [Caenorhabditis briggsae]